MGAARFLSQNLIPNAAAITVSSERGGPVGLASKVGAGVATLQTGGSYTGATAPQQYVVQIDSVAGGSDIGQATFAWRRGDDASWRASGVLTSAAPVTLETGVTVQWVAGSGTQFAILDTWTLPVDKPFGKRFLVDGDRDSEWRSADVAGLITIDLDLGSAQQMDALALLDHNLSATATIQLKGDAAANWAAPALSEAITRQASNLIYTVLSASRTYRYWRLELTDTANPSGFLRISELFPAVPLVMSQNFDRGWHRTRRAELYGASSAVRRPRGIVGKVEAIALNYKLMTDADRLAMCALFDSVYDDSRGTVRPFVVNLDSSVASDVSLYEWDTAELDVNSPYLARFEWSVAMIQRVRFARSGS